MTEPSDEIVEAALDAAEGAGDRWLPGDEPRAIGAERLERAIDDAVEGMNDAAADAALGKPRRRAAKKTAGKKPPAKRGRPVALDGAGLDQKEIAAVLEISEDTLTRRKQDADAVAAAIARGKAKTGATIGKTLVRIASRGNIQAIKWYETTRQGRSDKLAVENRDGSLEDYLRLLASEESARERDREDGAA